MPKRLYQQAPCQVAGVDEAGRGPLAGPVVACAVVLDPRNTQLPGLDDSKKLSLKKRLLLYDQIHEQALAVGISIVSHTRIDQINILAATLEAMHDAVNQVAGKLSLPLQGVLVDGNQEIPHLPFKQYAIVGGDGVWPPIMAASVIAKVTRDRLMEEAATLYPGYGFEKHKGYGTAYHLTQIARLGPSPIHRLSFAPLKQVGLFDANHP